LPALDVFKRDQPAQSLLVPLGESTIGPAELLFGGALTGMICRWKLTLSIDLGTTGRADCVITGSKRSPLQEAINDLGRELHPAAMHRAMLAKLDRDGRTARKLPFMTDCLWPGPGLPGRPLSGRPASTDRSAASRSASC